MGPFVCPHPAGAEVAGYLLPERSYEVAAINAAKGTFPITQAAAENDAGGRVCGREGGGMCGQPCASCVLFSHP